MSLNATSNFLIDGHRFFPTELSICHGHDFKSNVATDVSNDCKHDVKHVWPLWRKQEALIKQKLINKENIIIMFIVLISLLLVFVFLITLIV
jgi:hypothetical protein